MIRKKYTDEFKAMIVELHRSGKPPCETMREYAVSSSAYYKWVNDCKIVTVDDQKFSAMEIKSLKRENALLREEVEISEKALSIFAEKRLLPRRH